MCRHPTFTGYARELLTALTKHNNNDLHELSQQEVLIRKMVLLQKTKLENLQGAKKKEEMPIYNMSCQTPRNLVLESRFASTQGRTLAVV